MAVSRRDRPEDSSELEPYREGAVDSAVAKGGPPPPRDPVDGLTPLDEEHEPSPILWHREPEPRSVRRLPWRSRSIVGNAVVGAVIVVPALSCLLVLGLAQLLR